MIDLNELKDLRDKMRKNPASPAAFKKYKEALFASGEELIALASTAQDSAPAELPPLSIKTWQERLREKFPETADRNLFAVGHLEHAMEAEIADLRAALAAAPASPQPVSKGELPRFIANPDELQTSMLHAMYRCAQRGESVERMHFDVCQIIAASQPVAKVLDDSEIKMIAYGHRIGTEVAVKFARAILEAASTPTTLTGEKE